MTLRGVRMQVAETLVATGPLLACWSIIVNVNRQVVGHSSCALCLGAFGQCLRILVRVTVGMEIVHELPILPQILGGIL